MDGLVVAPGIRKIQTSSAPTPVKMTTRGPSALIAIPVRSFEDTGLLFRLKFREAYGQSILGDDRRSQIRTSCATNLVKMRINRYLYCVSYSDATISRYHTALPTQ